MPDSVELKPLSGTLVKLIPQARDFSIGKSRQFHQVPALPGNLVAEPVSNILTTPHESATATAAAPIVFGPEMVTASAGTRIGTSRWLDANPGAGGVRRMP